MSILKFYMAIIILTSSTSVFLYLLFSISLSKYIMDKYLYLYELKYLSMFLVIFYIFVEIYIKKIGGCVGGG